MEAAEPGEDVRALSKPCARAAAASLCLALATATPAALASASGEEVPVARGVEYDSLGANGARISTRLERLATRDWVVGPLAVRPFARAIVEGGQVTVRRPLAASNESPPSPGPAQETAGARSTDVLHRLAEGLAGRKLVAFRIRAFAFAALRGDERQLAIEAREADVQRDAEALDLHEVRAETRLGQRLQAERVRLRWDPERLEIRGPYRWCDGDRCDRGDRLDLAFEPSSGRLMPARRAPDGGAPAANEPGEREQRGGD